jgi:hypothetical protein
MASRKDGKGKREKGKEKAKANANANADHRGHRENPEGTEKAEAMKTGVVLGPAIACYETVEWASLYSARGAHDNPTVRG